LRWAFVHEPPHAHFEVLLSHLQQQQRSRSSEGAARAVPAHGHDEHLNTYCGRAAHTVRSLSSLTTDALVTGLSLPLSSAMKAVCL